MANLFVVLPTLAGNGSGAAVNVSGMGASKTITVGSGGGVYVPHITIEVSLDAGGVNWAPLVTFQGKNERTIDVACHWMRATTSSFVDGTAPVVGVGSTDDGATFATLVATVGNGSGAGVDVSAKALFKTIQVATPFRGIVNIEASEDGGVTYATVISFLAPGQQSAFFAADHMRATRDGVPSVGPGLPIISIAATAGGGGGGAVVTDATLTGNGTILSPLHVVPPAAGTVAVATDATLTGDGKTATPLHVVPPATGTVAVATDATLFGDGKTGTPLGLVGGPLAAGQFETNGNGVQIKTFSGVLATVEVRAYNGNPNGIVPGEIGSILLDRATPALWQNTTGAMVWTQIGGGGGGAPLIDTFMATTVFDINVPVFPHANFDDVVFGSGAYGNQTLCPFTTNSGGLHLRGIAAAADNKILCVYNDLFAGSTNAMFVDNDSAGEAIPANRIVTPGGGGFVIQRDGAMWVRYRAARQRWEMIMATP